MRQYALITGGYWAFTLTDGALRMLVVLYFHQLGYSPLEIALLFLFYEFFGVVTNLFGGWAAARTGLAAAFVAGLALQIVALSMLLTEPDYLSVAYVMAAQALSGIAKDLNKLSAKSSVKLLAGDREGRLFRWVAWLTGSKNALKGAGFFLGGTGLSLIGFQASIATMAISLGLVAIVALSLLDWREGRASFKPKFSDVWSKSEKINLLAAARLFLFGSRDVWFVVALPVFLQIELGWSSFAVGSFLAAWIIGYGAVQVLAPSLTAINNESQPPDGRTALTWALSLAAIPAVLAIGLNQSINPELLLISGLITFGAVFALNSAIHSYLIVSYASADGVSLDVGFYYMANAAGRLLGTACSGWLYQAYGIDACLTVSAGFLLIVVFLSARLPRQAKEISKLS
ncbi:MAG: organoarsenical effux MFS transporter ArsJ [Pseudomonadota bacterium]|nr:organoarsenical effux MFS transporter ArsJ [Pseudomonadota bacterium]